MKNRKPGEGKRREVSDREHEQQNMGTKAENEGGGQPAFTSLEIITHEYAGICGSEFKMSNVFLLSGWLS